MAKREPSRWWMKPLLSLCVFGVMLGLLEIGVRMVRPQPPSWLGIYRHHPALPIFALEAGVNVLVDTGESRWRILTDGRGFRVGKLSTATDHPIALWLGDSYTFGQGVEFEDSFVGLLAAAPGRRYQHLNAGVGGYGPTQYRQTLEYLLSTGVRPRLVLVATFLGNDFFDCVWNKNYSIREGVLGDEGGLKSFFKRRSHLYRLAAAAVHRVRPSPISQDNLDHQMADPRSWSGGPLQDADGIYRREFRRIAELCNTNGIELAVLVIPRATMVDALAQTPAGRADGSSDAELPLIHALSVFRELHIRHLDLTPVLARHPVGETYFQYDGHFTPRGHALAADAMIQEWRELLLKGGPPGAITNGH